MALRWEEAKQMKRVVMMCVLLLSAGLSAGQGWAQTTGTTGSQPQASGTTVAPAQPTPTQPTRPQPTPAQQLQQMQSKLNDWPDLARYREDDALIPPPAPGEQRVVFYGDSITDAWGRRTGQFFPGKPYVNRGISGQTTPQMLVRFEQDVVHLKPAAVVILAGTNDIAGNTGPSTQEMIEDNFSAMADIAKANGIKMIVASVLPAIAYPWKPGVEPAKAIRALNAWLKEFCAQQGLVYLDYYSAMADENGGMRPGLSLDGVHPSAQGYAIMAPLAEKAIAQALR
jgi:lysophospholipase L1-like esterase